MNVRLCRNAAGAVMAFCIVGRVSAHQEGEILIGRSAQGELKVEVGFDPFALPLSIFPGISGHATGEIGIHSAPIDEPEEDFFQLSPAADLRFILVAKDPGMEVWDDHGSGFMGVGDSFFVGEAPFDTHPVWNLLNSTPDAIYTLTLKLHDLNGVYPDSEPFTLNFTQFQPYRIFLSQTSPRQVTLSWPTNATDWALETASSMTSTNWAVVTNAPGISGANFALDFDTAAPQQFFRLHRQ